MKNSIFFKNIRYLVTCDDDDNLFENINMYIENGEIKYIGNEFKSANEIIDATDMVMYPGLINTHHHLYQIFSRNIPQVQNMELFPWLKYLYEIWKNINSDVIMYSSLCGMGELLKTGCTTCFDHHYVFPKNQNNLIESQFEAAKMIGIRMYASRGSMSLSVKDGGLPPDTVVQTVEEILKDSDRLVKKFHDKSRFSMRQVAIAPCSPFSVSQTLMIESAKLARKLGVRLHTHLAETKDEENFTVEKFNMRPLEYMESLGWLGSDVWFAHGIHFNDNELKLLASTGTGIAHCPISNMKLSSGIAKIPKMLKLNVPVGLGVDGSASNDGSNMLEEMRVAFLLHRLNSSKNAPTGYDILKIATRGSAKVLGRNDIGKLSVGMAGDLFMIKLNRLELIGADLDPKSLLSTVGFKGNVDYTIVNGKVVVKDGILVNIDEEKIYNESHVVAKKFIRGF
ncbi:8-oxoguanine deaminase [Clostridium psychrophilum]|uniref:8-oxoguanine deaminase n=1 Tax=Clostridium psychrophilum TaxID=132926 RepID=UPI001C0B8CBD|nr:8-oxoguanine deaminase [Clostridium psychrophilum]MBU3181770.1 8-oxoguanine deaminase [Clostridium psychrophilum]